jgi:low temperature requirement protein LtrA
MVYTKKPERKALVETDDMVELYILELQQKTFNIIKVFLPGCLICQCILITIAMFVLYFQYRKK